MLHFINQLWRCSENSANELNNENTEKIKNNNKNSRSLLELSVEGLEFSLQVCDGGAVLVLFADGLALQTIVLDVGVAQLVLAVSELLRQSATLLKTTAITYI